MRATTSLRSVTQLVRSRLRRLSLRGIARLMVYCVFASTLLAGLAIRSAYGDLKESALIIGRQLAQFEDLLGTTHRVRLNGESMYVSTVTTDQGLDQVLDRFETACRENAGGLAEAFKDLPASIKADQALAGSQGLGIVREDNSSEGIVACLSQHGKELESLAMRLREAVETGDLSKVGDLRYVYAKKTKNGRTHVITVWTEGPFRLNSIAPIDGGEAPGSDSANAPRPTEAVRLLSAEIDGAPHAVRIYDSATPAEQLLQMYDAQMPSRGWEPIAFVSEEVPHARAFNREGVDMMVFVFTENGRSYVSVVETRPRQSQP